MDSYTKNALKIACILALLAGSYSAIKFVNSYNDSPASSRSFAVRGEGRAIGVPDIAQFTFTVLTEKDSVNLGSIQSENSQKSNEVISFVKANGVSSDDITSVNYNINPRYEYNSCHTLSVCPPPRIVGYSINNSVQVKVRDFQKISALLSGVVANGANQVSGLSFKIDDPTDLKMRARDEAIARARIQADAIARASHIRLGRILMINDENVSVSQPIYFDARKVMASGVSGESAPQVEAGSQEVQAAITISYEIL